MARCFGGLFLWSISVEHFPPERDDRASLKALLAALDASEAALQRDPALRGQDNSGDWAYHYRPGWTLVATPDRPSRRSLRNVVRLFRSWFLLTAFSISTWRNISSWDGKRKGPAD
jgi:hypothetical protein